MRKMTSMNSCCSAGWGLASVQVFWMPASQPRLTWAAAQQDLFEGIYLIFEQCKFNAFISLMMNRMSPQSETIWGLTTSDRLTTTSNFYIWYSSRASFFGFAEIKNTKHSIKFSMMIESFQSIWPSVIKATFACLSLLSEAFQFFKLSTFYLISVMTKTLELAN